MTTSSPLGMELFKLTFPKTEDIGRELSYFAYFLYGKVSIWNIFLLALFLFLIQRIHSTDCRVFLMGTHLGVPPLSSLSLKKISLSYCFFQVLPWLKLRNFLSRDLNFPTSLRISSLSGFPLPYLKAPEPNQGYFSPLARESAITEVIESIVCLHALFVNPV